MLRHNREHKPSRQAVGSRRARVPYRHRVSCHRAMERTGSRASARVVSAGMYSRRFLAIRPKRFNPRNQARKKGVNSRTPKIPPIHQTSASYGNSTWAAPPPAARRIRTASAPKKTCDGHGRRRPAGCEPVLARPKQICLASAKHAQERSLLHGTGRTISETRPAI